MPIALRIAPLSLLLLVACATEPGHPDANTLITSAAGKEERIVCGREEPTGSRLKVKRCWTHEQLELEERDAEALIKRGQLVRPTPSSPEARGR
jgi:hypothetical protein